MNHQLRPAVVSLLLLIVTSVIVSSLNLFSMVSPANLLVKDVTLLPAIHRVLLAAALVACVCGTGRIWLLVRNKMEKRRHARTFYMLWLDVALGLAVVTLVSIFIHLTSNYDPSLATYVLDTPWPGETARLALFGGIAAVTLATSISALSYMSDGKKTLPSE